MGGAAPIDTASAFDGDGTGRVREAGRGGGFAVQENVLTGWW